MSLRIRNLAALKLAIESAFVCFLTVGLAAQSIPSSSSCTPDFALTKPWLGGDAAYSIPLPDGRVVWIFGDTLYGDKRVVTDELPRMVHNTVGVSTCRNGKWDVKYTIRGMAAGKPLDFFHARLLNTWYWAMDGVYYKGDLWVTLLCIRPLPKSESFTFGFEGCGTDLAHITGISSPNPEQWKVEVSELVPDGVKSYPSAAAVVEANNIYIFSQNNFGDRSLVATRIPGSGLKDPRGNLEYLANDGTWKKGFDPKDAKAVMQKGSSELSVHYHPELKKWIAVMFAPDWFSPKIILRTADSLTGPWTEGQTIYTVPEMQKDNALFDKDTFCYAGKEHPEFEKSGDLVFTYACNSLKPSKLVDMPHIYFPRTVRMKMPAIK